MAKRAADHGSKLPLAGILWRGRGPVNAGVGGAEWDSNPACDHWAIMLAQAGMAANILVIDDDPVFGRLITEALPDYAVQIATTGEEGLKCFQEKPFDLVLCDLVLPGIQGLEVIRQIRARQPSARLMVISAHGKTENLLATLRENVADFLVKPFTLEELRSSVANLLAYEQAIEVLSATPKWVELRVPASFQVAASLDTFFNNLHAGMDETTQRSVAIAFRELLNNAIEHGCSGDSRGMIGISYIRLERAIFYRIQDSGTGFDFSQLPHAAISYPDDPLQHMEVRQQQGMRAGGFGLLWIKNLADEVVFNEKRNKVMFIKYLDPPPDSTKT